MVFDPAPTAAATSVHNRLSRTLPPAATSSSRAEPTLSGLALKRPMPWPRSSRMRSMIRSARFQAASSVSASTGRNDRLNFIEAGSRPILAHAARTLAIVSRAMSSVSPQKA